MNDELPWAADQVEFAACMRILFQARGEPNAVTLDELVTRASLPNRRTAEAIMEQRLQDFPYPLVASSAGYYIPTTADDLNRYLRSLRSRAIKCFIRSRTVRRKALAHGWRREGSMFAKPPAQLDLFDGPGRAVNA